MYQDEYHPQIKRDLKKLTPALLNVIKTHYIPEILANPTEAETLAGDLNGVYSYHLNFEKQNYRIAYIVNEKRKTVSVLMIGKRGEFYTLLKKRIKAM